jgi:hypothetical protein
MSASYYLINPKTKKAYELGKGNWRLLVNKPIDGLLVPNKKAILKKLDEIICQPCWNFDTSNNYAYKQMIAEEIVKLGKNLIIASNEDWVSPLDGVTLIGSRYANL